MGESEDGAAQPSATDQAQTATPPPGTTGNEPSDPGTNETAGPSPDDVFHGDEIPEPPDDDDVSDGDGPANPPPGDVFHG